MATCRRSVMRMSFPRVADGAEAAAIGVGGDAEAALDDAAQRSRRCRSRSGPRSTSSVSVVVSSSRRAASRRMRSTKRPGRLADLGGEDAGEVAHAHGGRRGQGGHAVVAARRRLDEGLHGPDGRALGPGHPDRRGELGLSAGAVQEHHQPAGHRLRHVDPRSSCTSASDRSMPAVTPALVQYLPSRM